MAENRDSVTVTTTTSALISMSGNKNVTIRNLTMKSTTASAGGIIHIKGACENIDILNNYIKANLTNTSSTSITPIYKPSSTGLVKGMRIVGNKIEGGYYGIYLYGEGTGSYNEDVVVDSNEIWNQYYYATYYYYTTFKHITDNVLYSRTSSASTYWYGMRLYDGNV